MNSGRPGREEASTSRHVSPFLVFPGPLEAPGLLSGLSSHLRARSPGRRASGHFEVWLSPLSGENIPEAIPSRQTPRAPGLPCSHAPSWAHPHVPPRARTRAPRACARTQAQRTRTLVHTRACSRTTHTHTQAQLTHSRTHTLTTPALRPTPLRAITAHNAHRPPSTHRPPSPPFAHLSHFQTSLGTRANVYRGSLEGLRQWLWLFSLLMTVFLSGCHHPVVQMHKRSLGC